MNLKQNVDYIKEEINSDEKMLEGLFRLESWFRRNKKTLIVIAVIAVLSAIGYVGNQYYQANQAQKLSFAYENALKGDTNALQTLKDSKSRLYDLYLFAQALKANDAQTLKTLESSKDPIIAQFAKAQNVSLAKDINGLETSGDLGYLQAAFLEINNPQKAKEILAKIPQDSPIRELANALNHFSIKGIKNAE